MAQADFIPAGRTSRIVRENTEIQIQTEYAYRPNPRLTTSLFTNGRIVRKVEKELDRAISSFEDKVRIEDMLRKQHSEVLKIINDKKLTLDFLKQEKSPKPLPIPTPAGKISQIKNVFKVYELDSHGVFKSETLSEEFKNKYSVIFKGLYDILNIFAQLPGGEREKGVFEIQKRRLYFASAGREFFFVLIKPSNDNINYESEIKSALED
jgi:hypothetical protein